MLCLGPDDWVPFLPTTLVASGNYKMPLPLDTVCCKMPSDSEKSAWSSPLPRGGGMALDGESLAFWMATFPLLYGWVLTIGIKHQHVCRLSGP